MDSLKGTKDIMEYATSGLPLPGEIVSGDRAVVLNSDSAFPLVAVVDGAGHGSEASVVAERAVQVIRENWRKSLVELFEICHRELRGTRGAALSAAALNPAANSLEWMGVGDVSATLFRLEGFSFGGKGSERVRLVSRPGIIGYRKPTLLVPERIPLQPRSLLVLATDGVNELYFECLRALFRGSAQFIADSILERYRKGTDDALVQVVRYHGRGKGVRDGEC